MRSPRWWMLMMLIALWLMPNPVVAQDEPEIETEESNPSREQVRFINNLLLQHPYRTGSNYSQESKISLKNNGKLIIYTQYKTAVPCVATREEFFLKDLEPRSILIVPKDNTLIFVVSCKNGKDNCVQRFFRDSCNITFKPKDYLKDVNIITGLSKYDLEQMSRAFIELIKINSENSTPELVKSNTDAQPASNESNKATPSLTDIRPRDTKNSKGSLTMDDIETAPKPSSAANNKNKNKNKPQSDPNKPPEEKTLEQMIQEYIETLEQQQ